MHHTFVHGSNKFASSMHAFVGSCILVQLGVCPREACARYPVVYLRGIHDVSALDPFLYVFKSHVSKLVQVFKGKVNQKASLAWTWLSTLYTPTKQTLLVKDLDHSKSLSAGSLSPWMYVIWTRWLRVRRRNRG